jgi:hypothetical protein
MPRLTAPPVADLLVLYGAQEIADRAANEGVAVPGALLQATVTGADRSTWSIEEQAAADAALVRINRLLAAATADLRSRLARDDLLWAEAAIGKYHVMTLARAMLYDDAMTEVVQQGQARVDEWVRLVNRRAIYVPTVRG